LVAAIAVSTLALASAARGADQLNWSSVSPPSFEDSQKVIKDFQTAREQLAAQLTTVIKENYQIGYTSDVKQALETIGRLKLAELAPLCIQYLGIAAPSVSGDVMDTNRWVEPAELRKAAMNSLVEIGGQTVPALLDAAAKGEATGWFNESYAREVIIKIYGEQIGTAVIKQAIDAETDPQRKANLQKLLTAAPEEHPAETLQPTGPFAPHTGGTNLPEQEENKTNLSSQTTSSPAPPTGFPWYASGIIGLILGAAATFALTRKK
jgi:hypothetical protein